MLFVEGGGGQCLYPCEHGHFHLEQLTPYRSDDDDCLTLLGIKFQISGSRKKEYFLKLVLQNCRPYMESWRPHS